MKEVLNDLIKPIKEALVLRFSSPLTTSFAISWTLFNYKLILIILSNNKVSTIFGLINVHVYPDLKTSVLSFLSPLGLALAYLLIYERLSSWVHIFTLERHSKIQDDLKRVSQEMLITAEEKQAIQAEMISLRRKHKEEISLFLEKQLELEEIIDTLNTRNKNLNSQKATINDLQAQENKINKKETFSNNAYKVLTAFATHEIVTTDLLIKVFGLNAKSISLGITELVDLGLIVGTRAIDDTEHKLTTHYTLTTKGIETLARRQVAT